MHCADCAVHAVDYCSLLHVYQAGSFTHNIWSGNKRIMQGYQIIRTECLSMVCTMNYIYSIHTVTDLWLQCMYHRYDKNSHQHVSQCSAEVWQR